MGMGGSYLCLCAKHYVCAGGVHMRQWRQHPHKPELSTSLPTRLGFPPKTTMLPKYILYI